MLHRTLRTGALLAATLGTVASCGGSGHKTTEWPLPNLDLNSTRSTTGSAINRESVHRLRVAWRFRFRSRPHESGIFASTPVTASDLVLIQDLQSNVFALDRQTGAIRWRHLVGAKDGGPNGLAVGGNTVYGTTDAAAFALSLRTGKRIWARFLATPAGRFLDVAPQVAAGIVYVSTIGLPPNGRGSLYGLDAKTGVVRWRRSTIAGPWRVPSEAGGGGAWYPPSVAGGEVYLGTANPYPYGGTRRHPNGGAYAGPALYTDSLLVVSQADGTIDWYDQVTPHDVRDHDFQLSPIIGSIDGKGAVFGAGKGGIVIAWNRATHRRLWAARVGIHRNDAGPLPLRRVPVCPGLLGGVETPMALAGGMLFVPVVNLCSPGSAYGYAALSKLDPSQGQGELVALDAATGRQVWVRRLPQPNFGCATVANGVVFTSTFDGVVYGFDTRDGTKLWSYRMPAGINACPALSGDLLLVGAGVPEVGHRTLELIAFKPA